MSSKLGQAAGSTACRWEGGRTLALPNLQSLHLPPLSLSVPEDHGTVHYLICYKSIYNLSLYTDH